MVIKMRKNFLRRITAITLSLCLLLPYIMGADNFMKISAYAENTTSAEKAPNCVYTGVSKSISNRSGDGSRENPYNRFEDAVKNVADNGTIYITNEHEAFLNTQDEYGVIPFVIDKNITIESADPTQMAVFVSRAGGIILTGDVTFKNVEFAFANKYHDSIFANGHKLTLINTSSSRTSRQIDLFAGGLYAKGTDNPLLKSGEKGVVTVEVNEKFPEGKYSTLFGNIYGGSMNGDFEGSSEINVLITNKSKDVYIGDIYSSGAEEADCGNMFDISEPLPPSVVGANGESFAVNGDVNINIYNKFFKNIYGDTKSSSKTLLNISAEYPIENTTLNKVDSITVSKGKFKPKEVLPDMNFSDITIKKGAELDLSNGESCTADKFNGGGTITLANSGKLEITGGVTGVTAFQTKGAFNGYSGIAENNHTYITSRLCNGTEFTYVPNMAQKDYTLNYENGNWITINNSEPTEGEPPVVESFTINNNINTVDYLYINGRIGENESEAISGNSISYPFKIVFENPDSENAYADMIPFEFSVKKKNDNAEDTVYEVEYVTDEYGGYVALANEIGMSMEVYSAYDDLNAELSISRYYKNTTYIPSGKYEISIKYPTISGTDSQTVILNILDTPNNADGLADSELIVGVNNDTVVFGDKLTISAEISSRENTVSAGGTSESDKKDTIDFYVNGKKVNDETIKAVDNKAEFEIYITRENGFISGSNNTVTAIYGGSDSLRGSSGLANDINVKKAEISSVSAKENKTFIYDGKIHEYEGEFEIYDNNDTLIDGVIKEEIVKNMELSYKNINSGDTQEPIESGKYTISGVLPEGDMYKLWSGDINSNEAVLEIRKAPVKLTLTGRVQNNTDLIINISASGAENGLTPAGDIVFYADNTLKAVQTLSYGEAETVIENIGEGSHTVYAVYSDKSGCYNNQISEEVTFSVSEDFVPVSDITLSESSIILCTQDLSKQLTAAVLPENASDKRIFWKSSNTKVVSVDNEGNLTPIGEGKAYITATSADGGYLSICNVTVEKSVSSEDEILVEGIRISDTVWEYDGTGDISKQLTAEIFPENATNKRVLWSSSNPLIAQADDNGLVTLIQNDGKITNGEVCITAMTADGGFLAECLVKVDTGSDEHTSFSFDITELSLEKGGNNGNIVLTIIPNTTSLDNIIWSGSDENIVTVNAKIVNGNIVGEVIPVNAGNAKVTAVSGINKNVFAVCDVSVTEKDRVAVKNIIVANKTYNLNVGDSERIIAMVSPSNAENQGIEWKSRDESIVLVDDVGNITAVKAGKTIISAIAKDNAEIYEEIEVTVIDDTSTQPPIESVKPSESPIPTESAKPSESPIPTESTKPSESPMPTESAKPSESPMPTESAKPSELPIPTESAKPSESPIPAPEVIAAIGKYADKVSIEKEIAEDKVVFTVVLPNENADMTVRLFTAEYDSNGKLIGIKQNENSGSSGKMIISTALPASNNYKIMLWDNLNCPIIKPITNIN